MRGGRYREGEEGGGMMGGQSQARDACSRHGTGVDYNWEVLCLLQMLRKNDSLVYQYPGYMFGRGYLPESEVIADYKGLEDLLKDTRVSGGKEGGNAAAAAAAAAGGEESST
eukprot:761590-Hanusia_phi.AAC.2